MLTLAPTQATPEAAYRVTVGEAADGALPVVVVLHDRDERVIYRLGARGEGFGFIEHAELSGSTAVNVAEVVAIAREGGCAADVFAMVERALAECNLKRRNRDRLIDELADARNYERVALPPFQAALLHRLAEGDAVGELAERGGFEGASHLQRCAGLMPRVCRTGKRRLARTAPYDVAVQLAKAVSLDPIDLGI